MLRAFVLGAVSSVALLSAASAADVYRAPENAVGYKDGPAVAWTGFYAGLNAGYTWGRNDTIGTTTADVFDPYVGAPFFAPWGAASAKSATGAAHAPLDGFIGGGQLGYNLQFYNSFVAGVEADINGSGARGEGSFAGSTPLLNHPDITIAATGNVERSLDYLGTLRGRLGGLVTPSLLVYGTGGLAYGEVHGQTTITQTQITNPPIFVTNSGSVGSITDTRVGWTVGGGLEWLLSAKLSIKAEYLFYDLGSVSWRGSPLTFFNFTGSTPLGDPLSHANPVSSARFNGDIVRLGLNYHFGNVYEPLK